MWLLYLYLLPISLEYRSSDVNDPAIVFNLVIFSFSIFISICISLRYGMRKPRGLYLMSIGIIGFFLFITSADSLINGQPIYALFRNALPLTAVIDAIYTVSLIERSQKDATKVWSVILMVAGIAALNRLMLVLVTRGIDLSTVRYEVLSGATQVIWGQTVVLFMGPTKIINLIIILFNAGVNFISVTRTQLVVFFVTLGVAGLFSGRSAVSWKRIYKAILILCPLIFITSTIFESAGGVFDRWVYRLTGFTQDVDIDVSQLGRQGERSYQIETMSSDPIIAVFGAGLASTTKQGAREMMIAEEIIGKLETEYEMSGFGHNTYLSLIFLGGAVAGGPFTIMLIYFFTLAIRSVRSIATHTSALSFERELMGVPLGYVAYFISAWEGGIFGDRQTSWFFGLTMGMLIWTLNSIHRNVRE